MIDTSDAVGAPSVNPPSGLRTELLVFVCHSALTTRNMRSGDIPYMKSGVAEFESAIVSLFGFETLPSFKNKSLNEDEKAIRPRDNSVKIQCFGPWLVEVPNQGHRIELTSGEGLQIGTGILTCGQIM